MILEIDAGNTSLKWRWRGSAASSVLDLAQLESALAHAGRPGEVLVCNVRGAEFEAELARLLMHKWSLCPRFARVARECGGVRNQYPDPSRLGADRWLAMLAGYGLTRQACLIADSGTALTIDLVDASGLHLGGYIMPGLEALRTGLLRNTEIRLPQEGESESTTLGNDTGAAVRNGTLFMLCSAVRMAAARLRQETERPMLILTGGNAALLEEELGPDGVMAIPELVLDGLAFACAEAEG